MPGHPHLPSLHLPFLPCPIKPWWAGRAPQLCRKHPSLPWVLVLWGRRGTRVTSPGTSAGLEGAATGERSSGPAMGKGQELCFKACLSMPLSSPTVALNSLGAPPQEASPTNSLQEPSFQQGAAIGAGSSTSLLPGLARAPLSPLLSPPPRTHLLVLTQVLARREFDLGHRQHGLSQVLDARG